MELHQVIFGSSDANSMGQAFLNNFYEIPQMSGPMGTH